MADPLTPDQMAEKAQSVLGPRIETVRNLAERGVTVTVERSLLAAAEREYAAAFREAIRAGWTEAELKSIGAEPPARRAPGRPGGRSRPPGGGGQQERPPGGGEQPPSE